MKGESGMGRVENGGRRLNTRMRGVSPSATMTITSEAARLRRRGENVVNLAAGEPDFDTPDYIKEAAVKALREGRTKYGPAAGLLELREAVAAKLQRENSLEYSPEQIVVSNGAKQALFNVIQVLCDKGDRVLIPAPYWVSYPEMVRMAGAVPVGVPADYEKGYRITVADLERSAVEGARVLLLNSPCNPSGVVYTRREIEEFVAFALERGMVIISDEVYEHILFDGVEHVSPGSLSREALDATITINGFSKTYAMTGWRLGYAAMPRWLARNVAAMQSHSSSGPNTFAQYGALAALKGSGSEIQDMVRAYRERRDHMLKNLGGLTNMQLLKPQGTFYMLGDISAMGIDSFAFAERLLAVERVAVIPGKPFGVPGHVRLSYACSLEDLEEGTRRLVHFLRH